MKLLITRILASAAVDMWQDQTLNRYAAKTGEHELNLKFHYTNDLWRRLGWLNCDTDVIKHGFHRRRPDAIFHKRGFHCLNFLAVEVKRERDLDGTDADLNKIRTDWFAEPLKYRYGASVLLKESNRGFLVRLISRDQPNIEGKISSADNFRFVELPRYELIDCNTLRTIADRISHRC
jgi:hypothetical protein